jgi:hypothetical protein
MLAVTARVEYNHLPQFAGEMARNVGLAVGKASTDIWAGATRDAPVETGNLRNSNFDEEVGPYEHYVGNSAEYSDDVNFGTTKMRAQPFFSTNVERVRGSYSKAVQQAINGAVHR